MIKKLADEDCRAVDLLLDRQHGSTEADAHVNLAPTEPHRAISLERVLSLLHAIPVADPPHDLHSKTLSKIEAALAALQLPQIDAAGDSPVA